MTESSRNVSAFLDSERRRFFATAFSRFCRKLLLGLLILANHSFLGVEILPSFDHSNDNGTAFDFAFQEFTEANFRTLSGDHRCRDRGVDGRQRMAITRPYGDALR